MDRLYFDSHLQVEMRDAEGPPKITGYAARFNVKSEDLGGFREVIAPGAFADSIKRDEVVALWNHDASKPIARTGNGTLKLEEDDKGLRMEATPDDTSWAQDALKSVKAGTVYRTSFGFRLTDREKDQEWSEDGKTRTLKRVSVFDVSPVTFPAYRQTRIGVRAERIASLMDRLDKGEELRDAELAFLKDAVDQLRQALNGPPPGHRDGPGSGDGRSAQDSLALIAAARLKLAEHGVQA